MKYLFISVLFFAVSFCHAEGNTNDTSTIISGKVTSADDSSPLEGAIVVVKGTKNITGTMTDGAFSLSVFQNDSVLIVSLSGYETKEVQITKETSYEIILRPAGSRQPGISQNFFHKQSLVIINR